jgi:hypothetical protein
MPEKEIDKASDSTVIARITQSDFADRWRKMPVKQRRQVLEILAGRSDKDSIRSSFLEITTGQKSLF